jgi:hypothetical protein
LNDSGIVTEQVCRVVDRRVAVGVDEARGELVLGQPRHLAEDVLGGLDVEVGVDPLAEDVLATENLEEVELDVAHVGLVVTHAGRRFQDAGNRWGL